MMIAEPQPLLSRVAESVYWMSRYMERAENVARFITVNLHRNLDLPLSAENQWQPLIDTSGDTQRFRELYGVATRENVIRFLTIDETNPNSICSCLRAARENARSVRETISSEMWEQVNRTYLHFRPYDSLWEAERISERLRHLQFSCHLFRGISEITMSHNEAWHFMRLGGNIERAEKISRILDVKYFILLPSPSFVGTPYDDLHWSSVLKSVSGFEMYRKKHGRISARDIVDFLVLDREFPGAIRHCIVGANECLQAITRTNMMSLQYRSEQLLGILHAELNFTSVDHIIGSGLHEYLDVLQRKMNAIGDNLLLDFFGWRPQNQAQAAGTDA
jgi:uncharacterized alpha-E superfamily protein